MYQYSEECESNPIKKSGVNEVLFQASISSTNNKLMDYKDLKDNTILPKFKFATSRVKRECCNIIEETNNKNKFCLESPKVKKTLFVTLPPQIIPNETKPNKINEHQTYEKPQIKGNIIFSTIRPPSLPKFLFKTNKSLRKTDAKVTKLLSLFKCVKCKNIDKANSAEDASLINKAENPKLDSRTWRRMKGQPQKTNIKKVIFKINKIRNSLADAGNNICKGKFIKFALRKRIRLKTTKAESQGGMFDEIKLTFPEITPSISKEQLDPYEQLDQMNSIPLKKQRDSKKIQERERKVKFVRSPKLKEVNIVKGNGSEILEEKSIKLDEIANDLNSESLETIKKVTNESFGQLKEIGIEERIVLYKPISLYQERTNTNFSKQHKIFKILKCEKVVPESPTKDKINNIQILARRKSVDSNNSSLYKNFSGKASRHEPICGELEVKSKKSVCLSSIQDSLSSVKEIEHFKKYNKQNKVNLSVSISDALTNLKTLSTAAGTCNDIEIINSILSQRKNEKSHKKSSTPIFKSNQMFLNMKMKGRKNDKEDEVMKIQQLLIKEGAIYDSASLSYQRSDKFSINSPIVNFSINSQGYCKSAKIKGKYDQLISQFCVGGKETKLLNRNCPLDSPHGFSDSFHHEKFIYNPSPLENFLSLREFAEDDGENDSFDLYK